MNMHILCIKCASGTIIGMKVYFTCSTAEFKKYRESYYTIRNYLVKQGYVLTRDWLANADERIYNGNGDFQDVRQVYRACVAAIKEADLVIVEDTVSNFSTGHQITLALRARKPTLVLWREDKHHELNRMFIQGIESDALQLAEYNMGNLEETLAVFIKKYGNMQEESRFNLILNGVERAYLDWVRFTTGKSRTRVIRDVLRERIDHDTDYQRYLLKKG